MISSSSTKLNGSTSSSYDTTLSSTSSSPQQQLKQQQQQQQAQFCCTSNQNDSGYGYELNTSFNSSTSTADYLTMSKTNLIVNYLPHFMTQDEIKQLFGQIGQIETCKLIKDKLTGQSLGYAFVNYVRAEDAKIAVDTMNGIKIDTKIIKVSFARPSSDGIKGANLYICGLKVDTSQEQLEKLFNPFGTIISSKILTDPKTGETKGVGFVRYDQRAEAELAISQLNGKILDGYNEPIIVKFANIPGKTQNGLIGLPLAPYIPITRGIFQPYRSTTHAAYRYSPMSPYCTEGTLIHSAPQHAPTAPQTATLLAPTPNIALTGLPLTASIPLTTTMAPSLSSLAPQTINTSNSTLANLNSGWCIFIYNLGPEIDENTLWQLFGPFGAVQGVNVVRDALSFKCKGFAFVTMSNYEEAVSAITSLNGANLNGRQIQVSFKTSNNSKYIF